MPAISAFPIPSIVAAALFTASPTASSIEFVDVPVSVIVFSTMIGPPTVHYTLGPRGRCKACSPAVPRSFVVLALLALPPSAWSSGPDPSVAGRFAVGVTTRTFVDVTRGRTLVTEIWYPADTGGRDVPPRSGSHPLVLMAHGNCGFRTNY